MIHTLTNVSTAARVALRIPGLVGGSASGVAGSASGSVAGAGAEPSNQAINASSTSSSGRAQKLGVWPMGCGVSRKPIDQSASGDGSGESGVW